jgi:hypothetical protein
MVLTQNHRRHLLNRLDSAKQQLELTKSLLLKQEDEKNITDNIKELWEIDSFLWQNQIDLIEKSLIENDIDY